MRFSFGRIKSVIKHVDIEFIPELTVVREPQNTAETYNPVTPKN